MTKKGTDSWTYAFVRALGAFCSRLPLDKALVLGVFASRFAFYFSKRRRVAYAELKSAFGSRYSPAQRRRIIREHFAHIGQTVIEMMRFPKLSRQFIEDYVSIHHVERFYEAIGEKKGVILLTAHFGNWELLQIISGVLGKPIHVLARDQKHNRLNVFLNQLRESHGSVAISRGMGIRDLLRALRRQELIGVVGDQDAGKCEGVIIPFFGRKTTVPVGAFELARRTGSPVLPCFIVRLASGRHEIFVEEPFRVAPEGDQNFEREARQFIGKSEHFIEKFPSQWLWASKRWKHSWTKRLLILSDGKPGHVKQSEALAFQMKSVTAQYGRPGMEYPTETLEVYFKSRWHKMLFPFFATAFIPWAQGKLHWLRHFFKKETYQALYNASADFVISCGASLTPLNLCLARECRAKSIVLMKPSFPFNLFDYDLAVIPAHDKGIMPTEAFRTLLTPSLKDQEAFEESAQKIQAHLRNRKQVRLAVFLGGPTRRYRMDLEDIQKLMEILEILSGSFGDYLLTTSRRTPEAATRFLKNGKPHFKGCQMLVIHSEDKRPEVVPGMMALADILIVTEDSISMISEAVSAGKKVIVLSLGTQGLPRKHERFREILARESAVVVAELKDLEQKVIHIDQHVRPRAIFEQESEALRRRLQEIL